MKKVLLINPPDDPPSWGRNLLNRADLRIFTAATAEEGLKIHRQETVDLVITPLDIPDGGGDLLCSSIRSDQLLSKISIIIVCRDIPEEIRKTRRCGANMRLVKPVDPEQLDEAIGKLLAVATRKYCRKLFRAQLVTECGSRVVFGSTLNLSVSGLLIESDDVLPLGSRIPCSFSLPNGRQISAVGEIVRFTRSRGKANLYGVRFISIEPPDQGEIERFVAGNDPPGNVTA